MQHPQGVKSPERQQAVIQSNSKRLGSWQQESRVWGKAMSNLLVPPELKVWGAFDGYTAEIRSHCKNGLSDLYCRSRPLDQTIMSVGFVPEGVVCPSTDERKLQAW